MQSAMGPTLPLVVCESVAAPVRGAAPRRALAFGMRRETESESIPDMDDLRLVREMATGKPAALGAFYDKWSGRVYAVAVSIVREPADAEEVVEETFLQAWNQAARFDEARGRVASWILNIARSRSLDRLKAVKRRREVSGESSDVAEYPDSADPAGEMILTERSDAVRAALEKLPSVQRETLEMAYFGGLSQTEIAESTGQALGTVKTRMRLAMQKLREQLAPVHGARA